MIRKIRDFISDNILFGSWFSYLLLVSILIGMLFGISDVVRGLDAETLIPILIWSVIISLLMIQLKIPGAFTVVLALMLGFVFVSIFIGNLGEGIGHVFSEILTVIQQAFTRGISIDTNPLNSVASDLFSEFSVILTRTSTWVTSLPTPVYDPIVVSVFWSLLLWLASIWANWFFLKTQLPFIGALPAILTIGYTSAISNTSSALVFWMLAFTLVMIIIKNYVSNEKKWVILQAGFTKEIRKSSYQASVSISFVLIAITFSITSIDFKQIIKDLTEPFFSENGEIENQSSILGLEQTVVMTDSE